MAPVTSRHKRSQVGSKTTDSNQASHNVSNTINNHKKNNNNNTNESDDVSLKTSARGRKPSVAYSSVASSCDYDDDLVGIAARAKRSTQWEDILVSARSGPGRWTTHHSTGDFTVYSRQESQRYGMLAVGLVVGSAAEILNVLQCDSSAQYASQMEAVFQDQFKHGEYVCHVDVPLLQPKRRAAQETQVQLVELSVKSVTFRKAGWFAPEEQWCFLDAVYRHGTSGAAEKLMTPIDPQMVARDQETNSSSRTHLHDVSCAYLFLPETHSPSKTEPESNQDQHETESPTKTTKPPVNSTRIHFYGEYRIPKQLGLSMQALGSAASEKTAKQRLLKLADSNARIIALVRRQRLSLQTLVDVNRFLPPTNSPCCVCTKKQLVAKICRLCGYGVCTECSTKHERASQRRAREPIKVEMIRVCSNCIERVDRGIYENLTPSSLRGPRIVPDPNHTLPPDVALQELLHEALSNAPSPSRKVGVMNVIQCLLSQEVRESSSSSTSSSSSRQSRFSPCTTPPLLTPSSSDREYTEALSYVEVDHIPYNRAVYRTGEDRAYRMDTREPASVLNAPMADQEDDRLRAVALVDIGELCDSEELKIVCNLAASEMGCVFSTISILSREQLHCVAANAAVFQGAVIPRSNTACGHTILESKPHLVPHLESDIRFVDAMIVTNLGVKFYLGFPLLGDRDQIIGSFCVMNDKSIEVSESQFSVLTKLADTASKVLRIHTERRRRKSSTTSSSGSSR